MQKKSQLAPPKVTEFDGPAYVLWLASVSCFKRQQSNCSDGNAGAGRYAWGT